MGIIGKLERNHQINPDVLLLLLLAASRQGKASAERHHNSTLVLQLLAKDVAEFRCVFR